jgi:hypothetical protein
MNDNVTIKLTQNQANLLLQAAIFSCSTDITADWTREDLTDLVTICKLLDSKIDDLDLSRLQAYTCHTKNGEEILTSLVFEDSHTQEIMQHFDKCIKVVDISGEMPYHI